MAQRDDELCCCEYLDLSGNRSHILACCCDCEALDQCVDNVLCGGRVSVDQLSAVCEVVQDRLRVPTMRGAVRVDFEALGPLLVVPLALLLGAIHPVCTILVVVALPTSLYLWYRAWRRAKGGRTRVFYVWGLVSVMTAYVVVELLVLSDWWCSENLLLTGLVAAMLVTLQLARGDPGIVRVGIQQHGGCLDSCCTPQSSGEKIACEDPSCASSANHNAPCSTVNPTEPSTEASTTPTDPTMFGPMGSLMVSTFGMDPAYLAERAAAERKEERRLFYSIPPELVTWPDSRTTSRGYVCSWCSICELVQPARTAHCRLCGVCIRGRDHHCVWIDACVGAGNQRAFVTVITLYLASASYGCWLTLSALCPEGCRVASFTLFTGYSSFSTGYCVATVLYAAVSVLMMLLVLLVQVLHISQDSTGNEMFAAGRRGWLYCYGLYAQNNANNEGCLKNWLKFITGRRFVIDYYPGTADEMVYKSRNEP